MIITILEQKYNCGCNMGQNKFSSPGILKELNSIIEWKHCTWPTKKEGDKEVPNTEYLGANPELKPGDCFLYSGQVVAVDNENDLVLVLSETGVFALERFYSECIKPELEIFKSHEDSDVVTFNNLTTSEEILGSDIISDSEVNYSPSYGSILSFKERYMMNRGYKTKGNCIEAVLSNDDVFIIPVKIYILDWSIRYNKEELPDEEMLNIAINKIFAWFFLNTERVIPAEQKAECD